MPKEYITNACDLCKKSKSELIELLKELLSLYQDEFPKCKTFLSKDVVGQVLKNYCDICKIDDSLENVNNWAFYYVRDILIGMYHNNQELLELKNPRSERGKTALQLEYREKAFAIYKKLYRLLKDLLDIKKTSWGNDKEVVENIIKWIFVQGWISEKNGPARETLETMFKFTPHVAEVETAYEMSEDFLRNGRRLSEAPSIINKNHETSIKKTHEFMEECLQPGETKYGAMNSNSFRYNNQCWKCHKHISDKTNKRCEFCGWFICDCGKCAPECSREEKIKQRIHHELEIREHFSTEVKEIKQKREIMISNAIKGDYKDNPLRTDFDQIKPPFMIEDTRFNKVFYQGAAETCLDVLFDILDPIF